MSSTLPRDYYRLLKSIQQSHPSIITPIPPDEPFLEVNLDSREITLPVEFQDFLSVEKDHRAETIYFRMDRYFDDIDLGNMTGVIEYINALGECRVYPITLKDTISQRDKILFGWCIGGEATKEAGILQFAVRFYSVDNEISRFIYNLNTLPAEANILHGMDYIEDEEAYDYPASVIQDIYTEMDKLRANKEIYWIDL